MKLFSRNKKTKFKRVAVIGNYAKGMATLDGQTVKTRIIMDELCKQLGAPNVRSFDTTGGWHTLFKAPLMAIRALIWSNDVVILPAHNAVRVFVPLLVFLQLAFTKRKVHYVVIGGWLPTFIKNKTILRYCLRHLYMIYAETHSMVQDLQKEGYQNVVYMPNCKPLHIVNKEEMPANYQMPYRICTFSRVGRLKGIADAVETVQWVNNKLGKEFYKLDIYGKVEQCDKDWFANLQKTFGDSVRYIGVVPFDKSVETLKDYFFLLFPTKYLTEGIPGTIIDAYAAGLPVVSSLYANFDEIVCEGLTGYGYEFDNIEALKRLLLKIAESPQMILHLKKNCTNEAKKYLPENVMDILVNNINS